MCMTYLPPNCDFFVETHPKANEYTAIWMIVQKVVLKYAMTTYYIAVEISEYDIQNVANIAKLNVVPCHS